MVAGAESLTAFYHWQLQPFNYGRFSNPGATWLSAIVHVSPYKEGTALMFRFAGFKDKHTLTDLEIRVNIGLQYWKMRSRV